jgi:hypothetical protein
MTVVAVPQPQFPPSPDALALADVVIDSLVALPSRIGRLA